MSNGSWQARLWLQIRGANFGANLSDKDQERVRAVQRYQYGEAAVWMDGKGYVPAVYLGDNFSAEQLGSQPASNSSGLADQQEVRSDDNKAPNENFADGLEKYLNDPGNKSDIQVEKTFYVLSKASYESQVASKIDGFVKKSHKSGKKALGEQLKLEYSGYANRGISREIYLEYAKKVLEVDQAQHDGVVTKVALRLVTGWRGFLGKKEVNGGIDLNPAGMKMSIKGDGSAAVNAFDPAMFDQLQSAQGFVPVILDIRPGQDLPAFFGISSVDPKIPVAANS